MAYSFLDLAVDVLTTSKTALTYQEIWQGAQGMGLAGKVQTVGKTPWRTLGAQLYVDVRDNELSRFVKVGKRPARFILKGKGKAFEQDVIANLQRRTDAEPAATPNDNKERDLHPVLTYAAFANPAFNRGRAVVTKTIHHEKSKKSGYSDWTHPDMVGFSIPLDDWHTEVIAFNEISERNALTMFSFEIKRRLNKGTYREAYFQAVSNSSWAHQGYLVAPDIDDDDDLLAELERLASSFGIGILHLDLKDPSQSRVLYPARVRSGLVLRCMPTAWPRCTEGVRKKCLTRDQE